MSQETDTKNNYGTTGLPDGLFSNQKYQSGKSWDRKFGVFHGHLGFVSQFR
jgi:hypothetical protein